MKSLIYDKEGRLLTEKVAFWICLFTCLFKVVSQDAPDYAGLSVFMAPMVALYLGRSHTKAQK